VLHCSVVWCLALTSSAGRYHYYAPPP